MVSEMFEQLEDEEDDDSRKSAYNMDDVERDVNDKLSFAAWMMMNGNGATDVFEQLREVTADLEQEDRDSLISILEECSAQTNKPMYLGHWG